MESEGEEAIADLKIRDSNAAAEQEKLQEDEARREKRARMEQPSPCLHSDKQQGDEENIQDADSASIQIPSQVDEDDLECKVSLEEPHEALEPVSTTVFDKEYIPASYENQADSYGALTQSLQMDIVKTRFPWRSDGKSLRASVWQNTGQLPPNALEMEDVRKDRVAHFDGHAANKHCCSEFNRWFKKFRKTLSSSNPFLRSEIRYVARAYGSSVAHFVLLWRWLLTLNFIIFLLWLGMVIIPWFLHTPLFVDSDPPSASFWDRNDVTWYEIAFGYGHAASQSFYYYSGYLPYPHQGEWQFGTVWIGAFLLMHLVSIIVVLFKLINTVMKHKHDPVAQRRVNRHLKKTPHRELCELIFAAYDFAKTSQRDETQHVLQVQKLVNSLLTTLDDAYESYGVLALQGPFEFEADQTPETDRVYAKAMRLCEKRRLQGKDEGEPCVLYGAFMHHQAMRYWHRHQNPEEGLAKAKTELEQATEELKNIQEDGTATEHHALQSALTNMDSTVKIGGFTKKMVTKRRIAKAEQAVEQYELALAEPPPVLKQFHYNHQPNGMLMLDGVYRIACVRLQNSSFDIPIILPNLEHHQQWEDLQRQSSTTDEQWQETVEAMGRVVYQRSATGSPVESQESMKLSKERMDSRQLQQAIQRCKAIDEEPECTDPEEAMARHLIINAQGPPSQLPSIYAKCQVQRGHFVEDTPMEDQAGPGSRLHAHNESRFAHWQERRPHQYRYVYVKEQTAERFGEFASNLKGGHCCMRVFCMLLSILLVVATSAVFVLCVIFEEDIQKWATDWSFTLLGTYVPSLIITGGKALSPQIIKFLVRFEKWGPERAMIEVFWRSYVVKMVALGCFTWKLDYLTTSTDINGYQSSAVHQIGYQYFNLILVNYVCSMAGNWICYAFQYYWFKRRTEMKEDIISLFYVEVFYVQAIIWNGTPYCPVLPFFAVVLAAADCVWLVQIMKWFCTHSTKSYNGDQSQDFTEEILAITYGICIIPAAIFLDTSPSVGAACNPNVTPMYVGTTTTTCTQLLPAGPIDFEFSKRYEVMTNYWTINVEETVDGWQDSFAATFIDYVQDPLIVWFTVVVVLVVCLYNRALIYKLRNEAFSDKMELLRLDENRHLLAKRIHEEAV